MTSNRWLTLSLAAATMIPYGTLGGFGPGNSFVPWLGMLAGWGTWVLIARCGIQRGWWRVADEDGSSMSAHLRTLGLRPTATRADVKRAFRKQARQHHPDHGGDAAKFRELVEAKEHVLADLVSG